MRLSGYPVNHDTKRSELGIDFFWRKGILLDETLLQPPVRAGTADASESNTVVLCSENFYG